MAAIEGREVTHIAVSHTHRDHSPLARRLKDNTGAVIVAEGPHRPARPLFEGEVNPFAESSDTEFVPDRTLADGEIVEGDGWRLTAIHTPGHTANHAAFALEDTGILFFRRPRHGLGHLDRRPSDGAMSDYMTSLDRLLERQDTLYLPGHGGPLSDPQTFVRALRTHRRQREHAVLERIRKGDRLIPEMVKVIYAATDPRLHGAPRCLCSPISRISSTRA